MPRLPAGQAVRAHDRGAENPAKRGEGEEEEGEGEGEEQEGELGRREALNGRPRKVTKMVTRWGFFSPLLTGWSCLSWGF